MIFAEKYLFTQKSTQSYFHCHYWLPHPPPARYNEVLLFYSILDLSDNIPPNSYPHSLRRLAQIYLRNIRIHHFDSWKVLMIKIHFLQKPHLLIILHIPNLELLEMQNFLNFAHWANLYLSKNLYDKRRHNRQKLYFPFP